MLFCTRRCERAGAAARWFAARLTPLRDYLGGASSLRLRRAGREGRMMLHCTTLCGRAGAALSSFTAHNRLTTLSAWIWMTRLRDYLWGLSSVRFRAGRDVGTML